MDFGAELLMRLGMLAVNQQLHSVMLHAVLHAPVVFTDTTPSGRILSRFSKDLDTLDNEFPHQVSSVLFFGLKVCHHALFIFPALQEFIPVQTNPTICCKF